MIHLEKTGSVIGTRNRRSWRESSFHLHLLRNPLVSNFARHLRSTGEEPCRLGVAKAEHGLQIVTEQNSTTGRIRVYYNS